MSARSLARLVGWLFAAVLLASACGSATTQDVADEATEAAPAAPLVGEFTTISGGQIDLESLEGQDAVLWFWAPW